MRRPLLALITLAAASAASGQAGRAPLPNMAAAPATAGATVSPVQTIVQNAASAPTLTTFSAAITQAGLGQTLAGVGPYTVFAPTNAAFGRLAPGSLDILMRPENRPTLIKLLTYFVIPGRLTLADLKQRIAAGGGSTTLSTLEGEPITVALRANAMLLTDGYGNKSYVEMPDVIQANGVVHYVNGVLLPKLG